MMERGESIELDEFERFRNQAFSGSCKRKVTSTKSCPTGGQHIDPSSAAGTSGSSAEALGAGARRSSRMELLLREEGYMTTMTEEPTEDPDSSGSPAEDVKLLRRSGSSRSRRAVSPRADGPAMDFATVAAAASRNHRASMSGSKSPMATRSQNWLTAGPNTRLGRSYSCKPRTRPRPSVGGGGEGGRSGGGSSSSGKDRPRSGSAAHVYKTPVARHSSLTTPNIFGDGEIEIYRVRSFTTTAKGIVKHGDSFKIRSSPTPHRRHQPSQRHRQQHHKEPDVIVVTSPDGRSDAESVISRDGGGHSGEASLEPDIPEAEEEKKQPDTYHVLITGSPGVGKTALSEQLKTSDYLGNNDYPEDSTDNRVTVVLDEQETVLFIYDNQVPDEVEENSIDAHLITFSVEDRASFRYAEARLREVRSQEYPPGGSIVILVANKEDLVRSRDICEEEGIVLAKKHGCKYTEVSAILNHKVDELLVGIIRQIRLRPERGLDAGLNSCGVQIDQKQYGCLPKAIFELFRRLLPRRDDVSKSCENLLTL